MFQFHHFFLLTLALVCLSWVSVINGAPQPMLRPTATLPKATSVPKSVQPAKLATPSKVSPTANSAITAKVESPVKPVEKEADPCQCYVPAVYAPVCGSDQKVYPNKYLLECENKCSNKDLKVVHEGKC